MDARSLGRRGPLDEAVEHLKNYTVPLKPMLGCIAVAPPQEMSFRSGYLGAWGGNMDFSQLGEGATVYLPVMHPGALLFLGDGHAAQGDGSSPAMRSRRRWSSRSPLNW